MPDIYNRLVIYYFSGTGNARQIAEWMHETAQKLNIPAEKYSIDNLNSPVEIDNNVKTLIGFCSPTHGFNLPQIMLSFLYHFQRNKFNADVFILNTRAGLKMSKIYLPGASGIAQYIAAFILLLKGYKVVGMQPMDMPSNWISLHPGVKPEISDDIHNRCKRISQKFITNLINGNKKYKALISFPIDVCLIPISIIYYIIGRFMLAKTFIATIDCTACKLCEKKCPTKSIVFKNNRPYWKFTCESCMRCMNFCPERAIETMHTGIAVMWLVATIVFYYLFDYLVKSNPFQIFDFEIVKSISENVLNIIYSFVSTFLGYKFIHFLMRFKVFNYFIAYTSLTKFKFWRRYKSINPEKRK